jgi:uncharacterized phage protein (TIGR02218 family)
MAAEKAHLYFGAAVKPASAALIALLNSSEQFIMADLYTFTLVGVANGYLFAVGPKFERSKTKVVIGTQVDELDIKIYPEATDLVGSTPFLEAAWQGQFDGGLVQLERAFMGADAGGYGDTSAGTVILFSGRISDIDCSRTGVEMKCRSHLELLNIQMPRRLWQSSCTHVFGDAMCLFNRSSLAATFSAANGSTTTVIQGAPTTATPFAQGTIIAITGCNAGYSRTISSFVSGGTVTVKLAFLSSVAVGDQFQLLPGCDRTLATCTNVFNNALHFGGFPYIPTPETAV